MPRQPTAYGILGLPRHATTSRIRGRFRRLARSTSPGQPAAVLLQDPRFRLITCAYLLLMSPQRAEYDRLLQEGAAPLPDLTAKHSECESLALAAEVALVRGNYAESLQYAKQAASLAPRQASCWALLGEVMRQQGKYDDAIAMYNYAVQMDPQNQRYWSLLNEVQALKAGRKPLRRAETKHSAPPPAAVWGALLVAFLVIELGLFWVYRHPGPIVFLSLPINLVTAAVVDGLILGLVLGGSGLLGRFRDELILERIPTPGLGNVPAGVYSALPGLVCFWAAPALYALAAWRDQHVSRPLVVVMLCSSLITGSLVAIRPHPLVPNLLFAGNAVFAGMLVGWLLGTAFAKRH